jgi:hypothetical protein
VNPFHLAQDRSVLDDVFICREQDLELIDPELGLKSPALHRIAFVSDCFYCRSPFGKLPRPVGHCRQWNNNEVGTLLLLHLNEERDERNGLNGFAKALGATALARASNRRTVNVTISSARIPFSLLLYKLTIHCKPFNW